MHDYCWLGFSYWMYNNLEGLKIVTLNIKSGWNFIKYSWFILKVFKIFTEDEPPIEVDENQSEKSKDQVNFFSNFSTKVYKVANNASSAIKDKVSTTMIGEFNKEQEEFIKNKGNVYQKYWL